MPHRILQLFAPLHEPRARPQRTVLLLLAGTIPAFYLVLAGTESWHWILGQVVYAASGIGMVVVLARAWRNSREHKDFLHTRWLDMVIAAGILASLGAPRQTWSGVEWMLRLTLVAIIAGRLGFGLFARFAPTHIVVIVAAGGATMLLAGAGFYLLEPTVQSFADGVWLAFTSGATVGYGDVVPTAPAAKVFAVFTVLVGYGLLSIVTAAIAAVFIGEEEKAFQRELHHDIRELRRELGNLRREIHALRAERGGAVPEIAE